MLLSAGTRWNIEQCLFVSLVVSQDSFPALSGSKASSYSDNTCNESQQTQTLRQV